MADAEILSSIEWAIERLRQYRNEPGTPEHRHLTNFKRLAAELRAAEPERRSAVIEAMNDAIDSARRCKARIGYVDQGHMQHIAEGLLGRWWPTVRVALERFVDESVIECRE